VLHPLGLEDVVAQVALEGLCADVLDDLAVGEEMAERGRPEAGPHDLGLGACAAQSAPS
jgi:hypothetical protein